MAKRKDVEVSGSDAAANPNGAPEPAAAKSELPAVESPSISPATEAAATPEPAVEPEAEPIKAEAPEPISVLAIIPAVAAEPPPAAPRFVLRPRHKRYALLAASVTFAAALGAIVGAVASGGFSAPAPAKPDLAAIEQNKAMQQSIARLGKEVTTLKATLEQTNKAAHTQIAKISERLEHATAEITGSIAAPKTAALVIAPLPVPRPAQRVAALQPPPPARVPVVTGWTIRDTRDGYVYVESRGEIFQAQLGAPLPGLGPVQSIKRQDGRWMVQTPRGIIVSQRDRRYFEEF